VSLVIWDHTYRDIVDVPGAYIAIQYDPNNDISTSSSIWDLSQREEFLYVCALRVIGQWYCDCQCLWCRCCPILPHYPYPTPATRHKWAHPALTPAIQAGTRFTYPGGMRGGALNRGPFAWRPISSRYFVSGDFNSGELRWPREIPPNGAWIKLDGASSGSLAIRVQRVRLRRQTTGFSTAGPSPFKEETSVFRTWSCQTPAVANARFCCSFSRLERLACPRPVITICLNFLLLKS